MNNNYNEYELNEDEQKTLERIKKKIANGKKESNTNSY